MGNESYSRVPQQDQDLPDSRQGQQYEQTTLYIGLGVGNTLYVGLRVGNSVYTGSKVWDSVYYRLRISKLCTIYIEHIGLGKGNSF